MLTLSKPQRAYEFHHTLILPCLMDMEAFLGIQYSLAAARFMLAIALQESSLTHRYQKVNGTRAGPARGWFQFEKNGGVAGVMRHSTTKALAKRWTDHCDVEFDKSTIHRALEGHDQLAAGFARLLILTSPKPLPTTPNQGWEQYAKDLWRPGKPHLNTWLPNWMTAEDACLST